ncbi:hypothetical protein JVU11DRAFT_7636 [Chiua virens]|nr:hypothetical protein JVU11DRAFT_7636 [Chiua virens]
MSGLDYFDFLSLVSTLGSRSVWSSPYKPPFSSALIQTSSQPTPTRSYPTDPIQQHVAEDVIDSHICNMQRDDLPSSTEMTDRPREDASTLSGSYQGQGSSGQPAFPHSPHSSDSADDIQGHMLCAQLGGFHFTSQYGGHGGSVDEAVNAPTAIMEDVSWNSHHSLHYPTPVRGSSLSQCVKGSGTIAEDARPGLTILHCDVSPRVPVRRPSMAIVDRQLGRSYDFGVAQSPLPSMAVDVTTFIPGGVITSPSPPSTVYQDDDFPGADCAHAFTYDEQLPAMTRMTAHEPANHYPFDSQTVPSLGGYQEAAHQGIMSLDHRYATPMATPFPGYSSSQSPHDHPICESPSFSTAIPSEELPRPGSAPPLIDNQVPFVGDARAVLQSPENTAFASGDHVNRPHPWYPPQLLASTCAGQSPRSSPRRAGSIGHNSQKTPPGSRHLRRWSSVTNPALRASPPFSTSFSPNMLPFPRYPAPPPPPSSSDNCFSHFSPSAESESEDNMSTYAVPHAAAPPVEVVAEPASTGSSTDSSQPPQPPTRAVIRCDSHLIDEESWSAALARSDKALHVYECFWDLANSPCGMWIEGDQSNVADHLALWHGFRGGEVTTRCLWRDCPRPQMKGTSIARHVVTHIGFRVKCHTCKHEFARVDACNRAHSRSGCLGVGQPMYGDLQRVLDARKVDPLLRPYKKRRTDE